MSRTLSPPSEGRNFRPWAATGGKQVVELKQRIDAIDGLRGLAALLVFLAHYSTQIGPWLRSGTAASETASFFHAVGGAGVDLFFLLSGYLIYGRLRAGRQPWTKYLKRRIQRIYPTFVVVFALYVALSWAFPDESKIPAKPDAAAAYLLANLLLLPGVFPIKPMITVAWSLSFEMLFYVSCPLLVRLMPASARRAWVRTGFFVVSAAGLIAAAHFVGDLARFAMFFAGMTLYETWRPTRSTALGWLGLAAGAGGMGALYLLSRPETSPSVWTATLWPAFFLLCFAALQQGNVAARIFCWRPLRSFGVMSYSFFLIHGLALKGLFYAAAGRFPPDHQWNGEFWVCLPVSFSLALLPAIVLFIAVEWPLSLKPTATRSNE